jgi:hypothetical protein
LLTDWEKNMKHGQLALLATLLVGCASEPATKPAASETAVAGRADANGVICRKEAPSGSIVRKQVCTTPEEREAARRRGEMDSDALR